MRNLVSLQRRVWALEASSVSTDRCVAFASIPGESQAFFLRASGRIESLQLEEESHSFALFLHLHEIVDDGDLSSGSWRWMSYVAELGSLVCASTTGAMVSVDVEALEGEEVGSVDSGLRAVAWSDNQETLALITGAGSLLVMSNDWEVLHETEIEGSLPSELELSTSDEHWSCELCWREDSKFVALNIATKVKGSDKTRSEQKVVVFTDQLEFHALGRLEDGREIPGLGTALHWSQSLALIASCEVRKSRLVVVFFERNGLRHGEFVIPVTYRAPEYRVHSVRWNTSSDTLAVSVHPTDDGDCKQTVVQLWSRNNYHWYLKQELQLPIDDQLVDLSWDEEVAGRLNLVARSSPKQEIILYEHEFVWDISIVEAEQQTELGQALTHEEYQVVAKCQSQCIAVTGVIDGSKLLFTPLHHAMVPPPFALLQATFDAAINSVVFDSQAEVVLVLLANGVVVLVENYLTPVDSRTSAAGLPPPPNGETKIQHTELAMSKTTIPWHTVSGDEALPLSSLLWIRFCPKSRQLCFAGKSGRQDQLVFCSVENLTSETKQTFIVRQSGLSDIRRACEVLQVISDDNSVIAEYALFAVQTHSGAVYTINAVSDDILEPTRVPGKFPTFSHLVVLDCRSTKEKNGNGLLVVGLDGSSARLYVNNQLLASACSSFRYSSLSSVLLFTSQGRESQLRIAPLSGLCRFALTTGVSETVKFESRSIERGALLVATMGQRASVIVQMPRGNLECISPRLLVLALVIQQIQAREYVAALEISRRHRLDLNILVDFNAQAFLQRFSQFLVQRFLLTKPTAVTSDRLCLFITNLHPVDVWATKYGPLLDPFSATNSHECQHENDAVYAGEDKVNVVCREFMRAIQALASDEEKTESALLLPYVTCAVKQSPPRFDEALGKIQKLLHRNEKDSDNCSSQNRAAATRAIKHLIMLTNVNSLYSEALGLYDLDLVRTVATHSQQDPKEYIPFIDRVERFENENWRKYTIDIHLERHARALTHVAELIKETSYDNEEETNKLQNMALDLIKQGDLYDQALVLFPSHSNRNASKSDRTFRHQILKLKGVFLEWEKKYEAAAYVYLAASEKENARRAFIAANKWQMALALSARDQQTPDKLRNAAYSIAQELLNKQQQQQDGSVDDIMAVARIYVEYCNDIDEAVALLVTHQQWSEALRIAYLHQRDDLVESDVESGVLQSCDDVQEELERKQKQYIKHWNRLTTIREQKRLFKLHGIDGSRWDQGNRGDGDTDSGSIRSGASSAADSALSYASVSSVGSHNSAASIGNFSMQSLSMATASHFYSTQTLGNVSTKPKTKAKHGGIPSRRERRKRMKEGSAEEEAYVAQQLSELRPNAALALEVGGLLEMLVFFGHVQQAQRLQTQLSEFEKCVADKKMPSSLGNASANHAANTDEEGLVSPSYPQWRLDALQG
ncbi:Elongator complex protein 1 [Phytophthora megakarya]|uniref:Elongator complex protein 1 n=1 Tax=Phytophthora megakarya TaxID=4795 RepID=A0A225VFI0_9STRA|nr:Elongator complex protein 1 [Phytophthora megakarya]